MELSRRAQSIWVFIQRYFREEEQSPTVREICDGVGIPSTSIVSRYLIKLEKAGHITRARRVARGIRIVQKNLGLSSQNRVVRIPLIGFIVAGSPFPVPDPGTSAFESDRECVPIAREVLPNPDTESLYALKVKGHSMIDDLIDEGDVVIMKHQRDAQSGDIVAVWLKDEQTATLKRYYPESGERIRLQPANPSLGPIYKHPDLVEIQGKLVMLIRQPQRTP
jgi:repressor LexA